MVRAECEVPDRHILWNQDLSEPRGIAQSLSALLEAKGITIGHFVHSAGIIEIQAVQAFDLESALRLFNVNLFSALEIIRPLVRRRTNHNALGTITFVSSISARLGSNGASVYAASKGALNALTRSLAVELAPAVRVNAVLPGLIQTEGTDRYFTDAAFVETMKAAYPLGLGRPEDVGSMVEFLVSDRARWVTGQEFVVDGGASAVL
jgi:NAD(P)-dependent dehydrogenase (short-subunit alcohol dehydrogenase family)